MYLIFVDFCLLQFGLSLLLEGDDDEGDEDVDEEEGEDDEVDDVEDGHLGAEEGDRRLVLERRRHRLLQHTWEKKREGRRCTNQSWPYHRDLTHLSVEFDTKLGVELQFWLRDQNSTPNS